MTAKTHRGVFATRTVNASICDYVDATDVMDAIEKFNELVDDYRSRQVSPAEISQAAMEKVLNRNTWTRGPRSRAS